MQRTKPEWMLPGAGTDGDQRKILQQALYQQTVLEQSLSRITDALASGAFADSKILTGAAQDAQRQVFSLKASFSRLLEPTLYTSILYDTSACPAQRVFDVPELLEMILLYLPIPDVLSFEQINRTARSTVNASPAIQDHLSLRAAADKEYVRLPFNDLLSTSSAWKGFVCRPSGFRRRAKYCFHARSACDLVCTSSFEYSYCKLPRIGTKWRKMFVTQPPVKAMKFGRSCCGPTIYPGDIGNVPPSEKWISSDTGLILGDLYDFAAKVWTEHLLCPGAVPSEHDYDGYVAAKVVFTGVLKLRDSDPMSLDKQKWLAVLERDDRGCYERKQRLRRYIAYKSQGIAYLRLVTSLTVH